MTQKEILKNLSYLSKTIQPRGEWKEGLRNNLFRQLESSSISASEEAGLFIGENSGGAGGDFALINVFFGFYHRLLQPVAIALFLISFVGLNSLGLALAKDSLPGSFLYNYKKINEKISLNLIQNTERRISLKSSFAAQRLKEFSQLAKRGEKEKIYLSVNDFQENLNDISISFAKIGRAGKTEDLVKLAFILDAQTAEYEKILNQTNKEVDLEKETKEKVYNALEKSDKTGTEALKVVIREYENKEVEISKDELTLRLRDKIARAENKFADLGDLPVMDNKDNKIEEAKKTLVQAKDYLAEGSFSMALEKIEESRKISQNETEAENEEILKQPLKQVQDDNIGSHDDSGKDGIASSLPAVAPRNDSAENNQNDNKEEKFQKNKGDFQIDLIKENKKQQGFFGGLIKTK